MPVQQLFYQLTKVMKKYIGIAILAIGSYCTPSYAQQQVQTQKQEKVQKKEDKEQHEGIYLKNDRPDSRSFFYVSEIVLRTIWVFKCIVREATSKGIEPVTECIRVNICLPVR